MFLQFLFYEATQAYNKIHHILFLIAVVIVLLSSSIERDQKLSTQDNHEEKGR